VVAYLLYNLEVQLDYYQIFKSQFDIKKIFSLEHPIMFIFACSSSNVERNCGYLDQFVQYGSKLNYDDVYDVITYITLNVTLNC